MSFLVKSIQYSIGFTIAYIAILLEMEWTRSFLMYQEVYWGILGFAIFLAILNSVGSDETGTQTIEVEVK